MKKRILLLLALALLALAIVGCGSKENGTKKVKENLVVAQPGDAKSLDPHGTNDQPSSRVMKQIYDTLVLATEELEMKPALAESWERLDDTTWQFNLKKDVKFHNGEDFKAVDVKFSIERMMNSARVAHIVDSIDKVEIKDDYTVLIKTKKPFAPLLAHLSHTAASIVNKKAVTEAGTDYGQNPVGTGPFKFVKWLAGDKINLERYDSYFRGAAKYKTIEFRNIVEGTNRAIGLETGDVDIAYDLEAADKENIKADEKINLVEEPALALDYIGFNTKKAPLDNVLVRRAIAHAVNTDDIIAAALNGAGIKANSVIGPRVFGHNEKLNPPKFDINKAKELLKEAGYDNGLELKIWTNEKTERVQIAEIIQGQLKEIGIKVSIEILEWGSYLDRTANGEHDIYVLGWTAVTGDADYGLYACYHSKQYGKGGNRSFYSNAEVDKYLDLGKTTIDPTERKEIYGKAQKIIMDEFPVLPLFFKLDNAGVNSSVVGFKLHPAGHHNLYNVSFQ